MTLHRKMIDMLDINQSMTTQEIADKLNKDGLYKKKDGTEIRRNQVSARASKYKNVFRLSGGTVVLK